MASSNSTSSRRRQSEMEDLIAALLMIAGSWFVLSKALEAAKKSRSREPVTGDEWAKSVVDEIKKVREEHERTPEPTS